jgi:hypothetical protein
LGNTMGERGQQVKEKEIKRVLKIQAEQILQFEACEEYKQAIKGLQDRLWAIYSAGFEDGQAYKKEEASK